MNRNVGSYPGETVRNMFDRGKEHLAYLENQSVVLWLHSLHHHWDRLDIRYTMGCKSSTGKGKV